MGTRQLKNKPDYHNWQSTCKLGLTGLALITSLAVLTEGGCHKRIDAGRNRLDAGWQHTVQLQARIPDAGLSTQTLQRRNDIKPIVLTTNSRIEGREYPTGSVVYTIDGPISRIPIIRCRQSEPTYVQFARRLELPPTGSSAYSTLTAVARIAFSKVDQRMQHNELQNRMILGWLTNLAALRAGILDATEVRTPGELFLAHQSWLFAQLGIDIHKSGTRMTIVFDSTSQHNQQQPGREENIAFALTGDVRGPQPTSWPGTLRPRDPNRWPPLSFRMYIRLDFHTFFPNWNNFGPSEVNYPIVPIEQLLIRNDIASRNLDASMMIAGSVFPTGSTIYTISKNSRIMRSADCPLPEPSYLQFARRLQPPLTGSVADRVLTRIASFVFAEVNGPTNPNPPAPNESQKRIVLGWLADLAYTQVTGRYPAQINSIPIIPSEFVDIRDWLFGLIHIHAYGLGQDVNLIFDASGGGPQISDSDGRNIAFALFGQIRTQPPTSWPSELVPYSQRTRSPPLSFRHGIMLTSFTVYFPDWNPSVRRR